MQRIVDYPRSGKQGVRRFVPSWRLVLGLGTAGVLLGVIAFSVLYASVSVPDPNKLVTAQTSVVYWADGKTELGRFAAEESNRQSIQLDQVPEHVRQAVLAAEDRSFYSNYGVSPRGIARALWVKINGGSTQGGSTITQQYVKNYFLTQDRTYTRKVKEFVISLKIEQQESKEQILQNYLNTIYFGRGAFGIETASQAYFNHPASRLTVAEGAVLASVVRSPGLYDPVGQKQRAQDRMDYVLDGMVAEGWLSQAERDRTVFPKVAPRKARNAFAGTTGYLLKTVQDDLRTDVGLTEEQIDQGGLRIVTTFEKKMQDAAVRAMDEEMPTEGAEGVRAGLAAIKPGDGAVVAMYGGPDAVKQSFNAANQARMQAGSTFKPFTLAAALQEGISLRSRYDGEDEQTFPGVQDPVDNFGGSSYGRINLITATENSVNTAYVGLNLDVGPEKTVAAAVAAGLPSDTVGLEPNIANVLGTASPRVIDMADAYATFAAQGVQAPPYTIRTVTSSTGDIAFRAQPQPKRVFSQDSMADLTYALQAVTEDGSGSYAGNAMDRPVAGKTGTSSNNLSAWFTGYTPQVAAAVGLYRGDAKGDPISLNGLGGRSQITGGSFPVRIWTAFMQGAMEGVDEVDFPEPVYGGESGSSDSDGSGSDGSDDGGGSDDEPTPTETATETATPTAPPTETAPAEPTETAPAEPSAEPSAEPTAEPPAEPPADPEPAPSAEPPAEPTAQDQPTEAAAAAQSDPAGG